MDAFTTTDLLEPVLADLAAVVGEIPPDRFGDPTPCADYDVATLRTHVLSWLTAFAAGYADPEGKAPMDQLADYQAPESADAGATAVREPAGQLAAAIRDGAADRPLFLGESSMPGEMALSMILWEYLVHGWDLATATGQAWHPADAACTAALEFAPGMLSPDFQGEGKAFGPRRDVPDTAAPLDRLLGLSGRDPSWPPPA